MKIQQSRRQNLKAGLASLVVAIFGRSRAARADSDRAKILISQFAGGKVPALEKVKLSFDDATAQGDTVEIENGNLVPITISVDSPMNEASHVTDILVVADGSTQPRVVTFHFTPECGSAEAGTRIRLAKNTDAFQTVTAIAKMNDGTCYQAVQKVTVTNVGCG
jgi:sulfur-oxidizing protein SoxY